MAKGQVNVVIIKTNDDKLMLQVPEVDRLNNSTENNITIHDNVDKLLAALKPKIDRQL